MFSRQRASVILLFVLAIESWSAVRADVETSPTPEAPLPTVTPSPSIDPNSTEAIEALRAEIEADAAIDPEIKKKGIELCRQALENIAALHALEAKAADYADRKSKAEASAAAEKLELQRLLNARAQGVRESARLMKLDAELAKHEERLATLEEMLAKPEYQEDCYELSQERRTIKTRMAELRREAGLSEVEQRLAQQEERLELLRKELLELETEPQRRATRRKEARNQIAAAPEQIAKLDAELQAPVPADELAAITAARRAELTTHSKRLVQETKAIEQELALYDAEDEVGLLRLQSDRKMYEANECETFVGELRTWVSERRRNAAKELARRGRQEKAAIVAKHPQLADVATRNADLAQQAEDLIHEMEVASADLKQTQDLLARLKQQRTQTREKVDSVGMTGPIGLLLRQQRTELKDPSVYRREIAKLRDRGDEVHFLQFDLDEKRRKLVAVDAMEQTIDELVAKLGTDASDEARAELTEACRGALERQREYLEGLLRGASRYFAILIDLSTVKEQYANEVESYAAYIDERVLWIRSSQPLSPSVLRRDLPTVHFLIRPANLFEVVQSWQRDVQRTPVLWSFVTLLFGVVLSFGRRFRNELGAIGDMARRNHFYYFGPSLRATGLTFLISVAWPGLALFLGWRLLEDPHASPYAAAAGRAFFIVAVVFFPLELLRQICRPHGLAEAHFGWPLAAVKLLRRHLRWMVPPGLVLIFAATIIHVTFADAGYDSWQRLLFIATLLLLTFFMHKTLRPSSGIFKYVAAYNPGGWIDRLQHVWYSIGVVGPLAIALMTGFGYAYTANSLTRRIQETVWIGLALVLVRALLVRCILLYRRKISIQQARERRAAAEQAETQTETATSNIPQAKDEVPDIAEISSQAQRLLNLSMTAIALVGVWLVWVDVVPAINFWDRDPLWYGVEYRTVTDSSGVTRSVEAPVPVYINHLLMSVLIAAVTFVAARNLPGLLQVAILHRLPLEPAARYAITTLSSYVIVVAGIVASSRAIGIGWSQVQWLAAALTFGLGFGLQEIFANFVSGLIILFERPVRVGDIVTIDTVSGVVSRIRIRATTITDWDRKEFIVPNKEFITGRLLNWTLSDKMTRIVLNVGVEYGSDVEVVRELLLKVAKSHAIVLAEPPPIATFESFGESTLNFVLRAYLPNLDNRLMVINDLHTAVNEEFRKAGIVIPFPQRDLHVRMIAGAAGVPVLHGQEHMAAEPPQVDSQAA